MFLYGPSVAIPVAVQVISSPTASVVCGQVTVTPWSSVTVTSVSAALPEFVTT